MAIYAPQGVFSCRSVSDYDTVAVSFCAHGIMPSAIVVTTSSECVQSLSGEPQDCIFDYAGTQARFPDCILDQASVDFADGGQRMILRFMDHRWRWRNCVKPYTVSANRRIGNGSQILEGSRTSARSIAAKLLDAAGEYRRQIDRIPDDYPAIEIDGSEPPMAALESLVGQYGLRICYDPNSGIVSIVRPGSGNPLPPDPAFPAMSVNPPEVPDKVLVIGSEVVFQCRWELEAVAKEKTGEYNKLDEASYRPSTGWESVWPSNVGARISSTDEDIIRAAEESYLRSYRIKRTTDSRNAGGGLAKWLEQFSDQDGRPIKISKISQVLPISGRLIDVEKHYDGSETPKPARLYGKWVHERPDPRPRKQSNPDPNLYPGSFSIDDDTGIVQLSEPTYLLKDGKIKPAELELECTFSVRVAEDQMPLRASWEFQLSNRRSGTRTYSRGQLKRSIKFKDGQVTDDPKFAETGRKIASEIANSFTTQTGEVAIYNHVVPPQPDGALMQYDIRVGTQGATTQISRNTEASPVSPRYSQRRRMAKQIAEDR